MPLGVSTREVVARTPAWRWGRRGPGLGVAGGRERRTIRGGRVHPGTRASPAPPCRAPLLFSRVIFRYGVETQLGAARSLSRKRSLYCRRVYFAGDTSEQGHCPAARGRCCRGRSCLLLAQWPRFIPGQQEHHCFVPWSREGEELRDIASSPRCPLAELCHGGASRDAWGWHLQSGHWRGGRERWAAFALRVLQKIPPQQGKGYFVSCRSTCVVGKGGDWGVRCSRYRSPSSFGAVGLMALKGGCRQPGRIQVALAHATSPMGSAPGQAHSALALAQNPHAHLPQHSHTPYPQTFSPKDKIQLHTLCPGCPALPQPYSDALARGSLPSSLSLGRC